MKSLHFVRLLKQSKLDFSKALELGDNLNTVTGGYLSRKNLYENTEFIKGIYSDYEFSITNWSSFVDDLISISELMPNLEIYGWERLEDGSSYELIVLNKEIISRHDTTNLWTNHKPHTEDDFGILSEDRLHNLRELYKIVCELR